MPNALQTFEANRSGHDFVVGDIHGCFYMLDELLARIGFDEARDRLFCVGDLIDRGPDSERAVDFLDAPWFHSIRGNHEQMLLDAVTQGGGAAELWRMNGGDWFDALAGHAQRGLAERAARLAHAFVVELGDDARAAIVHADVPARDWAPVADALDEASCDPKLLQTLIWSRRRAHEIERRLGRRRGRIAVAVDGIDRIFFGHTPMPSPIVCGNTRWLDTGAFMGRRLSVAELGGAGEVFSLAADLEDCATGWTRLTRSKR